MWFCGYFGVYFGVFRGLHILMGRQETCHLLHLSKAKLGVWILFWQSRVLQEIFHLHDATLKNIPWLAALELILFVVLLSQIRPRNSNTNKCTSFEAEIPRLKNSMESIYFFLLSPKSEPEIQISKVCKLLKLKSKTQKFNGNMLREEEGDGNCYHLYSQTV